jgi:uncharacterized membrane-anchored protein
MKVLAAVAIAFLVPVAAAQGTNNEAEARAAVEAVKSVRVAGPATVKLADQASIRLPRSYYFVPQREAIQLLRAMGNRPSSDTLGLILPAAADTDYFVVVRYVASGYIKDDDARDWKVDEMLKDIKEGTEEANAERRKRGIPEMEVVGWVERPAYDSGTHRLVWSLSSKDKGASAGAEQGINYNTFLLGREGYVSMNLVTDLNSVEEHKPAANELLGALDFNSGKGYGDFNSATDKVAEYGLAALVGGIAAKKLGFFAILAALFAKSFKLVAVAAIGLIAGIRKLFSRPAVE